jgi:F-type H+-transporting ATPase subunit epsilon
MAETFQFELVSPERLLLSEPVEQVVVPGADGDFTVLKGHSPFMSTIRLGFIEVVKASGPMKIFVRGGFADATPTGLTVLAEKAIPATELKADMIAAEVAAAEADLAQATSEDARVMASTRIGQLKDIAARL